MEKKLYLRIQALILALFIMLSTCVIIPQWLHADEVVPAVEELTEAIVATEASDAVEQTNTEAGNEHETVASLSEAENIVDAETDSIPTEEISEADGSPTEEITETDNVPAEETEETVAESTEETDISPTESSADQELNSTEESDASSADGEGNETQAPEDDVADKSDDQAADATGIVDEDELGTRATRASDFDFDPVTGTITNYKGTSTVVDIPFSIGGVSVPCIGERAFNKKGLTSVTIPSSVKTIANGAFSGNQLTSITIPDSVCSIGEGAFSWNELTSVTIPSNVTSIEHSAFFSNELTHVTIPSSVTKLGDWAFAFNHLTSVTIPSSVTSIESYAFSVNRLTSVTIPNSVTHIGYAAFHENQLTSVRIPRSIISIGKQAFKGNPVVWASIPDNILHVMNKDGEVFISYPGADGVALHCFDNPDSLIILPQAVKNLRSFVSGQYAITITWNASEGADGYRLWRLQAGHDANWRICYTSTAPVTRYTDSVTQVGLYHYQIKPYKIVNGEYIYGDYSLPYTSIRTGLLPAIPYLQVKRAGKIAQLRWGSVTGAEGYAIYRQAPGEKRMTYHYFVTAPGFNDTLTTPGHYFYRVYPCRMVYSKYAFGPSNKYVYTTLRPDPVTNLRVTSVGKTARLRWTASPNADSYIIYRQAPGEKKMTYLYLVTAPGFNDTVTTPGYYFYRVYPRRVIDGKEFIGQSNKYVYTHIK